MKRISELLLMAGAIAITMFLWARCKATEPREVGSTPTIARERITPQSLRLLHKTCQASCEIEAKDTNVSASVIVAYCDCACSAFASNITAMQLTYVDEIKSHTDEAASKEDIKYCIDKAKKPENCIKYATLAAHIKGECSGPFKDMPTVCDTCVGPEWRASMRKACIDGIMEFRQVNCK